MSALTSAFTLILAEDTQGAAAARGFIVTDDGMLYGTTDNGGRWRCLGLVDTAAFLFDIDCLETIGSPPAAARTEWTRLPTRPAA
ncbi:MAG TPA: hypothetical protein VIL79_09785 [Thermoleophilia bacterium]